ncbi:hypothetical protein F5Y18DRAFT_375831 [Xylariaceae sp. FL1019]|nr:hypothetical protein F5Y18DRAFT_375831 [Xylariaceae sp. FL1019]
MDSRIFHCFSALPLELRLEIWEACLHPFVPSAQFFSAAYTDMPIKPQHLCVTNKHHRGLAAPRCQSTGELSWTKNNLSAYMLDHGLWTACHESRDVMLKHHKDRQRAQFKYLLNDGTVEVPPSLPTTLTGMFIENGKERCFSFNPTDDLLCFHLQKYEYRYRVRKTLGDGWHSIPFLHHEFGFSARHIALEFSSWRTEDRSEEPKVFEEYLDTFETMHFSAPYLPCCPKLWFIDYQTSLKPGERYTTEDRLVFRGFGCKLVEMKDYDSCWHIADPFYDWDFSAGCARARYTPQDVFFMIRRLKTLAELYPWREKSTWGIEDIHIEVGALVCVFE